MKMNTINKSDSSSFIIFNLSKTLPKLIIDLFLPFKHVFHFQTDFLLLFLFPDLFLHFGQFSLWNTTELLISLKRQTLTK